MKITIIPSTVLRILIIIILLLVAAGIAGRYLEHAYGSHQIRNVTRLFNLDGEANIPSFYSALALLAASLLLFFVAKTNGNARRDFIAWLVMAIAFLYLAFDEAAMLHEMLIKTLRRLFDLSGLLYNAWVIPYSVAMIIGGILYLPFLFRLPKPILVLFVISGIIFVSGAVGTEMLEGRYEAVHGTDNLTYDLYVAVEEFLEMFGVAVFIYALLRHISNTSREITLHVEGPNEI